MICDTIEGVTYEQVVRRGTHVYIPKYMKPTDDWFMYSYPCETGNMDRLYWVNHDLNAVKDAFDYFNKRLNGFRDPTKS